MNCFIRRGLPTVSYLEYVTRLLQPGAGYFFDPFAIDLRNYPLEERDSYVERKAVHDNLPGSRVFIGREGAGKSRLFKHLDVVLSGSYRTLFVNLPVAEMVMRDWGEAWMEGKVSCLTLEILVSCIFETYWKNYINNPGRRQQYITQFCDPEWTQRLHWFYNHYRPVNQEIEGDPKLTDWLNRSLSRPLLRDALSAEETLRQLIALITGRTGSSQEINRRIITTPYTRIEILIDDLERISETAASRLIREVQRLYDLRLGFKMFLPPVYQDRLDDLECARQGRIATYHLPNWEEEELKELLWRRWVVFAPGEVEGVDWSQYVPHLDPLARKFFFKSIINPALSVYGRADEEQDAPVHVLKLARAFLYASYECETRPENPRLVPRNTDILTILNLREITEKYWLSRTRSQQEEVTYVPN